MKLTVNWFGKDNAVGGCEEFFDQFKLIDPSFQHISFPRAAKALHGKLREDAMGFFEVEGGVLMDQYLLQFEKLFKPEIIVKNGWCGGTLKLNTPVICVHQDVHHVAGIFLRQAGYYNPLEYNRIAVIFPDLQRRNAFLADKNISVSPFAQKKLKEIGIESEVIPHGIDLNVFKPMDKDKLREEFKQDFDLTSDKIGLWVGRFHPQKGWHIMTDLIKSYPGVHWICLFSGELLRQPRLPNVTFLPPVKREAMAKLYNIADFYLMTSCTESFSLTTLESAACGIPVLGYKTGILDSEDGFGLITDEWDADGFRWMIDQALKGDIGINPRKAAKKYSIEKWKKAWKAII